MSAVALSDNNNTKLYTKIAEKGLLAVSVACAILSVIPPFRIIGNLALRVTSIVTGGSSLALTWKDSTAIERLLLCSKIALAAIGVVGVAIHSPAILTAILIADMAMNIFEGFKAGMEGNIADLFKHFLVFKIEAYLLIGIMTASAPYLLAAAISTAGLMAFFVIASVIKTIIDKDYTNLFDAVAYGILTAVSIMNIKTIATYKHAKPTTVVSGKNTSNGVWIVYNKEGHEVGRVLPGDDYKFNLGANENKLYFAKLPSQPGERIETGTLSFSSANEKLAKEIKLVGLTSPAPGTGLPLSKLV